MKLGSIVDKVYRRVSGGLPTSDIKIHRKEVSAHVRDVLIPQAILLVHRQNKAEDRNHRIQLPEEMYETYDLKVEKDSVGKYVDLPHRIHSYDNNNGIAFLCPWTGCNFIPLEKQFEHTLQYLKQSGDTDTYYYIEADKIRLRNISPVSKKLRIKMVRDYSNLTEDDEVILPQGAELSIIEFAIEHFDSQRIKPENKTVDNRDLNTT